MEEKILNVIIKPGNDLIPYDMYAIKTTMGELAIGFYSEGRKAFRTDDHRDIPLKNICAYASLEELQKSMNSFNRG